MALPTDVATSYPDDSSDPSIALHQQHHDLIHAAVNSYLLDKSTAPILVTDATYGLSGTADNTAAIQAALFDAAAQGRPVRFPTRPLGQPYVITLPAGKDHLLEVAANQVLHGDPNSVIQVKAGTGNYRSVFAGASVSTDLSGLVIDRLTIDQNSADNPLTNKATLLAGFPRYAICAGSGTGIVVRRCRFRDVDSLNTVVVSGPNVSDVRIEDNIFELVGDSAEQHDHSTIYVTATGQVVTGNVFTGVRGGLGATTAIETHGAMQVVTGNRVRDYFAGMNITGVAKAGSRGVVVANNVLSGVMIGIALWSYAGGNGGLEDCAVSHNTIIIDRDPWLGFGASAFPAGIMISPTNTATIQDLLLHGNTIRVLPFSGAPMAGELKAAGIALRHTDSGVEIWNLDVYDNTVVGALSAGLRLATNVRRGKISRNRFVDPGSSAEAAMPAFYRSGITVVGSQTDLIIEGNETYDTRRPHRLVQGVMTSVTAVTRCVQRDNTVSCTDGATVPSFVQTAGRRFEAPAPSPVAPRFRASLYYGPSGGRSVVRTSAGTLMAVPFWVPSQQAFDRIGCEITVGGGAVAGVRLGIYVDAGDGTPGALVLDAGAVSASTVGAKEIAISVTLQPGLYWLASVAQGGTPQIRSLATTNVLGAAGSSTLAGATAATPRIGYTMPSVPSRLPASYSQAGQTALPGLVVLRAA